MSRFKEETRRKLNNFFSIQLGVDPTSPLSDLEIILNSLDFALPSWLTRLFETHNFTQLDCDWAHGLFENDCTTIEVMLLYVNNPILGTSIRLLHAVDHPDSEAALPFYEHAIVSDSVSAEGFITDCLAVAEC